MWIFPARAVTAAGLTLAFTITVLGQMPTLRPGMYEKRSELAMAGRASKNPPKKDSICLSAQDVKDIGRTLTGLGELNCKDSDHQQTGNTARFTRTCSGLDGGTFEIGMTITLDSPESYRGVTTFNKVSGGPMKVSLEGATMTTTARRTGDCTK
ncbi:MAG TPA: DUF3617 family protein [Vicinamibacterales bacterium]|jgi:hypothetical protein|nr:DUF3617 family protein [Vicinamibacterales bacterium]